MLKIPIARVLADPSVRSIVKDNIRRIYQLDPVDAAKDFDLLHVIADQRCEEVLRGTDSHRCFEAGCFELVSVPGDTCTPCLDRRDPIGAEQEDPADRLEAQTIKDFIGGRG